MSIIFSKHVSFLLGLATFALVGSGLPAQAGTISAPVPGTTSTSATALTTESPETNYLAFPVETAAPSVAQIDIDPEIPVVGGSSYIGIAGNLGVDGETALGDGSFMIISKIGLTNNISVRPSVLLGDDTAFLVPLTYDFSILPIDAFSRALRLSPYLGAGVAISTGDEDDIGPLVTAGVDYGISSQFTATAAVNVGILDETDVGVMIGVGYNFSGLGL